MPRLQLPTSGPASAIRRSTLCARRVRPIASALALLGLVLVTGATAPRPDAHTPRRGALPAVQPNPNRERAGVLRSGVLSVTLEAKETLWPVNGPNRPPMTVEAFAEPGGPPLMPGPLLRVPAGTEIRLSVRNSLPVPLTFFLPSAVHGGPDVLTAVDSVVVAAGAVGRLTARAMAPGNYVYRATTPTGASRALHFAGLLTGGVVVDSAGADARPRDRVLVIMETPDSDLVACVDTAGNGVRECRSGRLIFTINGRSWPATERMHATVGDSIRWRVINASDDVHPMHLHGFYYRVDSFDGPFAKAQGPPLTGQMVVTQLMTPFSGMSMTWSPDRPGNWLFHCHFALHLAPDSISAAPGDPHRFGMIGLVIGTIVTARPGEQPVAVSAAARRLRLTAVARRLSGRAGSDTLPSMHFVLDEGGRRIDTGRDMSPELDLVRGEPVAITIVNRLDRPTTVHWHGIEIQDSYYDGVPGFSGEGRHLTPAIAPGDSFVARFTPPRSGTFMYHAHIDDVPEQAAGMEGALVVKDSGVATAPDDHVFFLKGIAGDAAHPLEIDGQADPDTVILHVGRSARFRLINLSTANPVPWFSLSARPDSEAVLVEDTMLVRWRPVAKDGRDLPAVGQAPCPATRLVAMGETYDFEYAPIRPGTLRLEVRTNGARHRLLIRVPIRVESADVKASGRPR